jgi:hypothetical protein
MPGETHRRTVWVALDGSMHWIFYENGKWAVALVEGGQPIEVAIIPAQSEDIRKASELFNEKACAAFLWDGAEIGDTKEDLQALVRGYPDTPFSACAAWVLVQANWRAFPRKTMSGKDADWDGEKKLLNGILECKCETALKAAAMAALVRHYQFQKGQAEKAKKAAEELATAYPYSVWAHSVKSVYGHDVSDKLKPYSEDPVLKLRRELPPASQPSTTKEVTKPAVSMSRPAVTTMSILDSLVPADWQPKKAGSLVFGDAPAGSDEKVLAFTRAYLEAVISGELRKAFVMLAPDYINDRGDRAETLRLWRHFADRHELPRIGVVPKSVVRIEKYIRPRTPRAPAKEWVEPIYAVVAEVTEEPTKTNNGKHYEVTLALRPRDTSYEVVSERCRTENSDAQDAILTLIDVLQKNPAVTELQSAKGKTTLADELRSKLKWEQKRVLAIVVEGWMFDRANGKTVPVIFGRVAEMDKLGWGRIGDEYDFTLRFSLKEKQLVLDSSEVAIGATATTKPQPSGELHP